MDKVEEEKKAAGEKRERSLPENGGDKSKFAKREGFERGKQSKATIQDNMNDSAIVRQFREYSLKLDEFHDKRERIIKASRDITIGSKRLIFLLHRTAGCSKEEARNIIEQAKKALTSIHKLFGRILSDFVSVGDFYRFARQYSPGMQEYIEAVLFYDFVSFHLGSISENVKEPPPMSDIPALCNRISSDLESPSGGGVITRWDTISESDYMLGVLDLSGEIMRLCVNYAAVGDREMPRKIMGFAQMMCGNFQGIRLHVRDFSSKMQVLRDNVGKIERACYAFTIVQSEFPEAVPAAGILET